LRQFAIDDGAGFTEEVAGKGVVEVSAGSEAKFKGFNAGARRGRIPRFAGCPTPTAHRRPGRDVEKQFTKATRPAVTVRL
jgi:hypothetical protein